jgi:putative phosphoesterase
MKLGIMSDSHDNMPLIAKAVALFNSEKVDLVLHAGDIVSPFTNIEFGKLNAKMVAVFGNNDGDKPYLLKRFAGIAEMQGDFRELAIGGRKIVLMHQPKFLEALAAASDYDLVVYGHTHIVDIREGKPLVINPGECGGWLYGKCTVATLDLETMTPTVHPL